MSFNGMLVTQLILIIDFDSEFSESQYNQESNSSPFALICSTRHQYQIKEEFRHHQLSYLHLGLEEVLPLLI